MEDKKLCSEISDFAAIMYSFHGFSSKWRLTNMTGDPHIKVCRVNRQLMGNPTLLHSEVLSVGLPKSENWQILRLPELMYIYILSLVFPCKTGEVFKIRKSSHSRKQAKKVRERQKQLRHQEESAAEKAGNRNLCHTTCTCKLTDLPHLRVSTMSLLRTD